MNLSDNGFKFIKKHEGCRLVAYDDLQPKVKLTKDTPIKGTLTIGYGYTGGVKVGDVWTQKQADDMFVRKMKMYIDGVNTHVKVPLNQNQFDALVSFTYNVGVTGFATSTLCKLLNAKDFVGASKEFAKWNKSKGNVLVGLTKRREEERVLFTTPVEKKVTKENVKLVDPFLDAKLGLVDWMKAKGMDSSFHARSLLAAKYKVYHYSGTSEQNTELLNILKSK